MLNLESKKGTTHLAQLWIPSPIPTSNAATYAALVHGGILLVTEFRAIWKNLRMMKTETIPAVVKRKGRRNGSGKETLDSGKTPR